MAIQKAAGLGLCLVLWSWMGEPAGQKKWLESFTVDPQELATVGENPYFILKPGYQQTYESKNKKERLVITVLHETRNIGGYDTRVVEERETENGELIEVSRNFFAISKQSGDVYYFGEEVDMYKKGKIVSHDGAWQHGVNGAKFGLMMPAKPALGLRYYQEQAKGVAMDRAEIVSLTERVTTPAGTFERCVKMKETTPLEMFGTSYKVYAAGVGMIKDGSVDLVSYKYL